MDMNFDDMIREATRNISKDYFTTQSFGGCERWLERPYAYEFYHQLRRLWPRWPDRGRRIISGEVSKASHNEFIKLGTKPIPDFLVHEPGLMDDNYAVIEIKHQEVKRERIDIDICKLLTFINKETIKYDRAIYLFYGPDLPVDSNNFPKCIELWHHDLHDTPACKMN